MTTSSTRRSRPLEARCRTTTGAVAVSSCVFLSSTTLSAMASSGGGRGFLRGSPRNRGLEIFFRVRELADHALDGVGVEPLKHRAHHVLAKLGEPVHQRTCQRGEVQALGAAIVRIRTALD